MRIRMFRTTAEAKGEDLDPVNMFKTPPPPPRNLLLIVPRRYFCCGSSMLHDNLNNVLFQN